MNITKIFSLKKVGSRILVQKSLSTKICGPKVLGPIDFWANVDSKKNLIPKTNLVQKNVCQKFFMFIKKFQKKLLVMKYSGLGLS